MINTLCLKRYHPDQSNPDLKIFKITGYEHTEGLAFCSGHEGGPIEFTISAPCAKDVQLYIWIYNMDDASTWSDCHTHLNENFTEVTSCDDRHIPWNVIIKPSYYQCQLYSPENIKWAHIDLFGYSPDVLSPDNAHDELSKFNMSYHSWEDHWSISAT